MTDHANRNKKPKKLIAITSYFEAKSEHMIHTTLNNHNPFENRSTMPWGESLAALHNHATRH